MIFSFLWVIIGDLVAMHIRVIYGVDIQGQSPFSKTNKSDKKVYKVSKSKTSDFSTDLGTALVSESNKRVCFIEGENIISFLKTDFISSALRNFHLGRAPPII